MKLTIATPEGILLNCDISKVTFETPNGYYTLLPKHVDFVSALNTGIMTYQALKSAQKYAAIHEGIVVKKGEVVTISVQGAVLGNTLPQLQELIKNEFKQNEEKRKELNTAMAKLELGLMRGFNRLKGEIDGAI